MRQFPILIDRRGTKGPCPSSIPWDAIAPFEKMAKLNHRQTLERLAERGGLCDVEAFFVMTGRTWDNAVMSDDLDREACAFLTKIVTDDSLVQRRLAAADLVMEEADQVVSLCGLEGSIERLETSVGKYRGIK